METTQRETEEQLKNAVDAMWTELAKPRPDAVIVAIGEAAVAERRTRRLAARGASCPTGTTEGHILRGGHCAVCGRTADWNPGAGRALCPRHWDEY